MESTGEILRRARSERHLTLDEVAIRTRINRKYLAAIESGDRDAIPGGFFYKSFVRQYATALTTDETNVLEQVEQSLAAEHPGPPPAPDEEVLKALAIRAEEAAASSPGSSHSAASYAVLLVLAIAGTSGLYMLWHRSQQAQAAGEAARPVPQVAKKEEPARTPAPVAVQPAPETQAQTDPPPPVVAQPETAAAPAPDGTQAATPSPQGVAQTPATAPGPDSQTASNPPVNPPSNGASNPVENADEKIALSISANDQSWVTVAADGKTVFNGLLAAGQSRAFAARENARMRVGNAGGLNVMFNGKPTGPLGADRQAVTLLFTPGSFEIVKPKPPDAPAPPPQ